MIPTSRRTRSRFAGCAAATTDTTMWNPPRHPNPLRTTQSLFADIIFGRDKGSSRTPARTGCRVSHHAGAPCGGADADRRSNYQPESLARHFLASALVRISTPIVCRLCGSETQRYHYARLLIGAAPYRVEEDGQSSFRLLASEHPENAGETSHVFTCTIRVV